MTIENMILPQTAKKYTCICYDILMALKFKSKSEVKKKRGRKSIVMTVKTRMA